MMSEYQDWGSLDWAIVFEDQDHDTMYIPDKAVALKLFEAKASNWNCHLFYRVSSEAGIDYPPSEMQVLQKEKQQQAETIEKMDRDFDELAHKDTEKAEAIKQLEARIARFQSVIGCYVADMFNSGVTAGSLEKIKDVVNETPQQSTAEIQADAVEVFLPKIKAMPEPEDLKGRFQTELFWRGAFAAQQLGTEYTEQLRQQAKGGSDA